MPKRILGFATMVPEVFETDLDFSELEIIMQVKLKERHRAEILKVLNHYLADATYIKKAPTVAKVRKRAEEIEKSARTLARHLSDPSELGQATVGECWPWKSYPDPNVGIRLLRDIAFKAKVFHQELPSDKPGRSQEVYLAPFIATIGKIYDYAGGEFPGISSNHSNNISKGRLFEGICWLLDKRKWDHQSKGKGDYPQDAIAREITKWRKEGGHEKYKKPENWS